VLAFSLQKLEAMAVPSVQAEVANEDAPFEVAAAAVTRACSTRWCPRMSGPAGRTGASRWCLVAAIRYATRRGGGRADGHRLTVIQSARQGAAGHSTGRFKVRHKYVDVHVRSVL